MTHSTLDFDDVQAIVQRPDIFFTNQLLQDAKFRTKPTGGMMTWAGARAWVFCGKTSDGQTIAVRLPKNPRDEAGVRYEALGQHMLSCPNVPLVNTRWAADAAS